jgi:hypothetical protein
MKRALALTVVASIWALGLAYMLAQVRPRSWAAVGLAWGGLTAVTTAISFAMRNAKMAAIFSAIGLVFCAAYAFLRI